MYGIIINENVKIYLISKGEYMQYQYIPYIWPLIISGIMTLTLGFFILIRYRKAKASFIFAISMFVVSFWAIPNALEMSAITLPTKLFWANVQYIAYCYCPVTLLMLVMQFTGHDRVMKSKRILLLLLIPTIILLLVWTNNYHSLIRYKVQLNTEGQFPVISKQYGVAFYLHTIYSHSLNLLSILFLVKTIFFQKTIYRKQTIMLLIGIGLIEIPNALYVLGISPIKRFDITPVFFGPCAVIIAWSMFRYQMFDLIPLAWATVINTMDAGVIVVDLQDRILETNQALDKIMGYSSSQITSKHISDIGRKIPELSEACLNKNVTHAEFTIVGEPDTKTYEILLSPLNDHKGKDLGRIAVVYEITEKKKVQQELLKHQWRLAVIEEKERIGRDMHDNLGQVLGFINLQAQGIRQELINLGIDVVTAKLDRLVDVTQQAHTEIREYIQEIRNTTLIEKDFIMNIRNNIQSFGDQTGIAIQLEIPEEFVVEVLEPNCWLQILNIVKEGLNNIQKHADAKHVKIQIVLSSDELYLSIVDDGKGFDLLNYGNGYETKFGLNIMQERAHEIGGQLKIKSAMGKGCKIILRIPRKGALDHVDEIDVGR